MEMIQQQQRAIEKLQKSLKRRRLLRRLQEADLNSMVVHFISENKLKIGGTVDIELTNKNRLLRTQLSDLALSKATLYFEAQPHEMVQTYVAGVFNDEPRR